MLVPALSLSKKKSGSPIARAAAKHKCFSVANGFTYLSKHLELEGSEVGQLRPNLGGEGIPAAAAVRKWCTR